MTANPSQTRKPYDAAPYASLRSPEAREQKQPASAAADPHPNDIAAESDKLRALREALWAAFEAGPAAGLPNTLIDLTMAYTGALRLQLNLRALAAGQRKVRPVARPEQKPSTE